LDITFFSGSGHGKATFGNGAVDLLCALGDTFASFAVKSF
jgi:hypothetical protein